MFVERKLNSKTNAIELWKCEWENVPGYPARKIFLEKMGDEQPIVDDVDTVVSQTPAICWSYGRTLGNIAVFNQTIVGSFSAKAGNDALLPCDFVNAGKFRHGPNRWWCRTHQSHWGTKADLESYGSSKVMTCANHAQPMSYVVEPFTVDLDQFAEVGIWCSMPAAIATRPITPRPPRIHVHVRSSVGEPKIVDRDFPAIALSYRGSLGMFEHAEITRVNVTPPAAFEFVRGLETDRQTDCINCAHCGYPHLDLGNFALKPHRKHFCANCGRDSTWSATEIVSTPLKPMHDAYTNAGFESPARVINLDNYAGCDYSLWASTSAIIWTAKRPQEIGIHVHVHNGSRRVIDDTYAEVIIDGRQLQRNDLLAQMIARTII